MSERILDVAKSASIVADRMKGEFEFCCYNEATELAPHVESEIELMLLVAFCTVSRLGAMKLVVGDEIPEGREAHILITPQYKWENYRIDFRVRAGKGYSNPFVFVECDGHEFHERTKEQAERDRSKDRAIQSAGIPILRFTGREIWRDPGQCVLEIIKFISAGLDKR